MNLSRGSIARQLAFSFISLILLFLLFSLLTLYYLQNISGLTRTIYNHPLVVSNAALQANVSITKIHRNMKDVVLFNDQERIEKALDAVAQQEQRVYSHLNIVREHILGAEGKQLEAEARALFSAWRPIREEEVRLVSQGKRENAAEITIGKGAAHVALLENRMLGLTSYARDKATVFMKTAEKTNSTLRITVFIYSLLMIVLSGLIALFTLKRTASAEEELTESRQLLMNAIDFAPIGMMLVTPDGRFYKVNKAFCDIVGYNESELLKMNFQDVTHPDDFELGFDIVRHLLEGKKDRASLEKRYLTKDGRVLDIFLTTSLLRDSLGRPLYFFTQIQDVTDRKQAEEYLRQSEEKYRGLFENALVGVGVSNIDGQVLECNDALLKITGYNREEVMNTNLVNLYADPDDRRELIERMKRDGYIQDLELQLVNKKYGPLWVNFSGKLIKQYGEEVLQVTILDITERKAADEALKKSTERYRKAQEIGLVANWEYDLKTESFWGSEQAKRLYGFDPESERFSTEDVESCIPERGRVHQALIDLIEKEKPYNLEFEILPVDGSAPRIIRSLAELVRDESGTPWKVAGVIQDITQQKQDEEERFLLARQLRQSQKMESIGTLAGGIAHDFNNILSAVIGFTELALDDVAKGTVVESSLQEVYSAGKRARKLVRQILTYARQSEEEVKPIPVNKIAGEVLGLIRSSLPATIDVQRKINSQSLIMGNETQVHQILMNLCANSAQAMEDDGGTLAFSLTDTTVEKDSLSQSRGVKPGGYIKVEVSDTGGGIAPEHLQSIFDPYFTTKGLGEGTGMGLAVVHGIVEGYGGKILVDSTLDRGSTFTVYLPIASGSRDKEQSRGEADTAVLTGTERVLFVDDEEPIVRMNERLLSLLGYSVTVRTDSLEALALFRNNPDDFDLVITDMTMPGMTGDKLAAELITIRPDIPVILCTGYSEKLSEINFQEIGVKACVHKPIAKSDLAKVIRDVLDVTRGELA